MSENSNSYYRIPEGEHNQAINSELDAIYQSQNVDKVVRIDSFKPNSNENESYLSRLNSISDEITKARVEKIDAQGSRHAVAQGNFVRDVSKQLFNRVISPNRLNNLTENDLKTQESSIGAGVFGPVMSGERREFFNDNGDWFFHQDIVIDSAGNHSSRTLHYEVLPEGVLLVGRGIIHDEELNKFTQATEMYYERVMSQLYSKNVSSTDNQLAA